MSGSTLERSHSSYPMYADVRNSHDAIAILQQQAGLVGFNTSAAMATLTPTYDLGCPFGVKTATCPFGSVHNVNKRPIGARIAAQIVSAGQTKSGSQFPGPALASVRASGRGEGRGEGGVDNVRSGSSRSNGAGTTAVAKKAITITVTFAEPVQQKPTQNCAACCTVGNVGDFDASFDGGRSWVNGTRPQHVEDSVLSFQVHSADADGDGGVDADGHAKIRKVVTHVRYVFNQASPQCAIYAAGSAKAKANSAKYSDVAAIPAMPFSVQLNKEGGWSA